MKLVLSGILVSALCSSTTMAADLNAVFSPQPFRADPAPQAPPTQTAYAQDVGQKSTHSSKKKFVWIAAGIGAAVVTGIVLANRAGGSSGGIGTSPQPGGLGSVVVIRGIPQ
jgi:hypothetical protein